MFKSRKETEKKSWRGRKPMPKESQQWRRRKPVPKESHREIFNRKYPKRDPSCTHCAWLAYSEKQDYPLDLPKYIPKISQPIYTSDEYFMFTNGAHQYAFEIVMVDHDIRKVQKLFIALSNAVQVLDELSGFTSLRTVFNSHYDVKRGSKEHLHAWLIPMTADGKDLFNRKFGAIDGYSTKVPVKYRKVIAEGPYPNDLVVRIPPGDCADLSKMSIEEFFKSIRLLINPYTESFYLFLSFINNECQGGKLGY